MAIAASSVLPAGSKPCGSPIRSTRETAAPDTTAQPVPARAQQTETLCSAEKPSVPKKSRSRRSRISPRQRTRCPNVYSVRVSALDASMPPWALMTTTDDLSRRLANRAVRPSQGCARKPPFGSTEGAGGVFMVIPDMRLSPVCSARANALRGQRRTADPIPDWLRVSTWLTFHRAGAIVKTRGAHLGVRPRQTSMAAAWQPCDAWRCVTHRGSQILRQQRVCLVFEVGGEMLSPSESEAWRRRRRCVRELLWRAGGRVGCAGFGSADASVQCRTARR
jgi:hypothetical protein